MTGSVTIRRNAVAYPAMWRARSAGTGRRRAGRCVDLAAQGLQVDDDLDRDRGAVRSQVISPSSPSIPEEAGGEGVGPARVRARVARRRRPPPRRRRATRAGAAVGADGLLDAWIVAQSWTRPRNPIPSSSGAR